MNNVAGDNVAASISNMKLFEEPSGGIVSHENHTLTG